MKKLLAVLLFVLLSFCVPALAAPPTTTVMVYMCASDMYDAALYDLLEMCEADLGSQVQVAVMAGGAQDWDDILEGDALNRFSIENQDVADDYEALPMASMGDPETLCDFLDWAVNAHPADRYVLVLWDHGGGTGSGICWDESAGDDFLSIWELYDALYTYEEQNPDFHLDLIGFDACLMGTYELASHLRDLADFMVASEELEPGNGWDYTAWLGALSRDPAMDTQALGVAIADSFVAAGLAEEPDDYLSMSVTYLPAVANLCDYMEAYSAYLVQALENGQLPVLSRARDRMYSFGDFVEQDSGCVDMMAYLNGTRQFAPETAQAVEEAYKQAVRYCVGSTQYDYLTGLSIFFPTDFEQVEDLEIAEACPNHSEFFCGYVMLRNGQSYAFDVTAPAALSVSAQVAGQLSSAVDIDLPAASFTANESAAIVPRPDAAEGLPPAQSGLQNQPGAQTGGIEATGGLFSGLLESLFGPQEPEEADVLGYSVTLTAEQLEGLSMAEGLLLMDAGDEEDTILVEMGSFQNVVINWQTGEIVSLFDYTLPMLNDEIVVLYDLIVTDSLRRSVIPVALNGQEGYLLVTQTPAKPGWTVVEFSTGYNANGMPDRGITRPQAGDVIAPLYPAYYLTDDDMEEFQVEGDGFTVGADGLKLSFESMAGEGEALTYYYAFLFTDIYGETDMSDFVILEM